MATSPAPEPLPAEAFRPGDRIKRVRLELALSQKAFAERLRLSQSTLSQIENDRYHPSYATVAALATEFAVDCNWLLRGTGEVFVRAPGSGAVAPREGFPTVHEKARAGYTGQGRDEHWLGQLERYTVPGFRPDAEVVIFQSLGDSMEPTIVDQDFVLGERVRGTPESFTGQIVVCVVPDEIYVKRLANFDLVTQRLTLASDNPKYKTIDTAWEEIVEMWHVVGRITRSMAPTVLNQEYRIRQLEGSLQELATRSEELAAQLAALTRRLP